MEPNSLLAFKAIALAETLSAVEKRVASAIIDHFNRATGQCDPGINRLAGLLQISRSSVIRAIAKLERLGFLRRTRHGGHFHRNSYEPCWTRFEEAEAAWSARRRESRIAFRAKLTPSRSQARHRDDRGAATQTCLKNPPQETLGAETGSKCRDRQSPGQSREQLSEGRELAAAPRSTKTQSCSRTSSERTTLHSVSSSASPSRRAVRSVAEWRWNTALLNAFGADPPTYARIVEAMTPELQAEATNAECSRHGDGLRLILERLRSLADGVGSGEAAAAIPSPAHGSFLRDADAGISDREGSPVSDDFESLNLAKAQPKLED